MTPSHDEEKKTDVPLHAGMIAANMPSCEDDIHCSMDPGRDGIWKGNVALFPSPPVVSIRVV